MSHLMSNSPPTILALQFDGLNSLLLNTKNQRHIIVVSPTGAWVLAHCRHLEVWYKSRTHQPIGTDGGLSSTQILLPSSTIMLVQGSCWVVLLCPPHLSIPSCSYELLQDAELKWASVKTALCSWSLQKCDKTTCLAVLVARWLQSDLVVEPWVSKVTSFIVYIHIYGIKQAPLGRVTYRCILWCVIKNISAGIQEMHTFRFVDITGE